MKPFAAIFATATAICLSSVPAFSQSNTDEKLAHCRMLESKEARLICYDNLADMRKGAAASSVKIANKATRARATNDLTNAEKAAEATVPVKTTMEKREEEFGSESVARNNPEIKEQRKKEQLKKIEAQVLEILFTVNGKARYMLNNGQSWQQIDTAIVRRWKVPFKVVLKRGSIGSYKLNKVGNNVSIRVKRIK